MSTIKTTTLNNGLRIVTDMVDSVHSVALGIWVGAGARNEEEAYNGAAHFLEHMLFKGTKTRSTSEIASTIESVGGDINAYTSRELTSYHIHLLKENMSLALEILSDMYQNSILLPEEIEKERQVILQEIGMGNDTPDDCIFDYYYETAYPDQPMGAPILGKNHHVERMSQNDLFGFIDRFYTPENTVISVAGNINHDEFVAQVEALFGDLRPNHTTSEIPALYKGGEFRISKDLEQSHVLLGFEGVRKTDEDFYNAQALAVLMGGGMSSRLFQEVREKRGLVYSIYSFHSGYKDSGQFAIYAGTGPDKLEELIPVVCDEVQKTTHDITQEELTRVKSQLKASLLMSRESMMNRADRQAKYMLTHNRALNIETLIEKVEAIDIAAVQTVASRIFSSNPTLAALGPLEKLEDFAAIEKRLAA